MGKYRNRLINNMSGINNLQYLNKDNLKAQCKIINQYYNDLINSHGIECIYYRKDLRSHLYDDVTSAYINNPQVNYVLGEKSTATYYLTADINTFVNMMSDDFLLNFSGIETNGDAEAFVNIDHFNNQFRDYIGKESSSSFNSTISGDFLSGAGILTGNFINEDLTGTLSVSLTGISDGGAIGIVTTTPIITEIKINPDISHPKYWNDIADTSGNLSGTYNINLLNGIGVGVIDVNGTISYHAPDETQLNNDWNLAPQVGDVIRFDFHTDNHELYEVTRVSDRDLGIDGLNPLLDKYIWKLNLVRYDASYEEITNYSSISGVLEEEQSTNKEEYNEILDEVSNDVFDYETEKINSETDQDDIYGGYSN